MECINLHEQFGLRFKITFDPIYDARGRHRDKLDPWMMQIPGERGIIFPWSTTRLAVEVDGRPVTVNRLQKLGGLEIVQNGDRESTFAFSLDWFSAVAEIVKPRRRRQMTAEQRRKAIERLRAYRFKSCTSGHS